MHLKDTFIEGSRNLNDSGGVILLVISQICRVSCFMHFSSDTHARACTHTHSPSSFTPQPNPVYPPQLSSPPLLSCCLQRIFLSFAAKKRILKGGKHCINSPCSCFFFSFFAASVDLCPRALMRKVHPLLSFLSHSRVFPSVMSPRAQRPPPRHPRPLRATG